MQMHCSTLVQAAIQHQAHTIFQKLHPVICPLQQWVACSGLACAVCLHPWRSAVCESDLASQFVLNWAEANYGAVMSLFHKIVRPNFFPSPDKITVAGRVWCGWHSQSASSQSQLPSSAAIVPTK